jgi:hypothetical protein
MKRTVALVLCFLALPVLADESPSGFLSDYERLSKQGPIRARYLGFVAKDAAELRSPAVYVAPVARFPADARFPDIDDALIGSVLTYTEQQLRSQLAVYTTVVDEQSEADVSLEVALTALGSKVEGKTPLDLVPMRMVTGRVKDATMGKAMDATAVLEMRVTQGGSGQVLRESLHPLVGDGIGRDDNEDTRITLDALKPALDKWVVLVVEQLAPKR